jgi:hypothetical protein
MGFAVEGAGGMGMEGMGGTGTRGTAGTFGTEGMAGRAADPDATGEGLLRWRFGAEGASKTVPESSFH